MPRIRCRYLDCIFLDDGVCMAASVEIDPDDGCQAYATDEPAEDDDELYDDEELGDDEDEYDIDDIDDIDDEDDWYDDDFEDDDFDL